MQSEISGSLPCVDMSKMLQENFVAPASVFLSQRQACLQPKRQSLTSLASHQSEQTAWCRVLGSREGEGCPQHPQMEQGKAQHAGRFPWLKLVVQDARCLNYSMHKKRKKKKDCAILVPADGMFKDVFRIQIGISDCLAILPWDSSTCPAAQPHPASSWLLVPS